VDCVLESRFSTGSMGRRIGESQRPIRKMTTENARRLLSFGGTIIIFTIKCELTRSIQPGHW